MGPMATEDLMLSLRDSMIQRFEFTIDLFWKFIKSYLEEKENVQLSPATPRATILTATKSALLSETEAEEILKMFESRNLTSHVYQERIAKDLAKKLPFYQALMAPIFQRLIKSLHT
jgi:nucleotidyltransferase substrate binding protein (TIGR01987 family)